MKKTIDIARKELQLAADAINLAKKRIDKNMEKAVEMIYSCQGKTVVTGMGKTGLIGRKISATLASTGSSSIFLHPAEGIHGDLGIIGGRDVVLAVSYSGNTEEIIRIIPFLRFNKIPIISITANLNSELAKNSEAVLNCSIPDNYEPFNLVPTVSTTVALTLGDALAVALIKKRDFKIDDFARFHPGGTIGKRMLLRVADLMHQREALPYVIKDAKMSEVLLVMTEKGLGCTGVVDQGGHLLGIITDGDLRRILTTEMNVLEKKAFQVMTKAPKSVTKEVLAIDALALMEEKKITMLPVVDKSGVMIGMLHMHDIIDAGVVG